MFSLGFVMQSLMSFLVFIALLRKIERVALTNLCRMEFPIDINWNSPFLFLWMLGGIFHIYSNFNRIFCKQTVENLIRRRLLRRLVWFFIVCRCPTKRTLGLNGILQ